MRNNLVLKSVKLEHFVHGGQCIATVQGSSLYAGYKLFVWGGLPGETVDVRVTKKKSSYLEGIVDKVVSPSEYRIEPKELESYLSTSPWQIVDYKFENISKQKILKETFERERIDILWEDFYFNNQYYEYRNKLEIGFWGSDDGLKLAHFVRGTHGKVIASNNVLVADCINSVATEICNELNELGVWAGKLKTLILRSNKIDEVVGALFVKEKIDFREFKLPLNIKGLKIYLSDAKSPASIPTELLYDFGDTTLSDVLLGQKISYDVLSFFQVNLDVFENTLERIKVLLGTSKSVDLYSGVGTIGVAVKSDVLIESDENNIKMAKLNTTHAKIILASAEKALDFIDSKNSIIVDPPRAGLHVDVINKILKSLPPKIVYLSCNPSTQARDVKLLLPKYRISFAKGYNYFPRTPHIESLLVLERQ